MDFTEFQSRSYKNIQPHSSTKDELLNWCVGLCEEVGETMNVVKHHFWPGENINEEKIAKELGDVLWYVSAIASNLNLNLGIIARLNIEKLEHRYQQEFSKESSDKRHELEKKFSETEDYKILMKNIHLK